MLSGRRHLLLIGASGFVGTNLRAAAEEAGLLVTGTSRSGDGAELACDLRDPDSVSEAVEQSAPDLVANLAGAASVAESWERPAETLAVNADGTLHLLEAVGRFAPRAHVLCISSAEVYGEPAEDDLPLREEAPMWPVTPYGASKAAMEVMCGQYERSRGMRIAIARAFNLLGPGQSHRFVASGFARQIAEAETGGEEKAILSVGNLSAARDFTDVRDGAAALLGLIERELTGTYNLCSGRATGVADLVELMRDATELPVEVSVSAELARPADVPVLFGDYGRLHEATGWRPATPLERTISDMLRWWRQELAARSAA